MVALDLVRPLHAPRVLTPTAPFRAAAQAAKARPSHPPRGRLFAASAHRCRLADLTRSARCNAGAQRSSDISGLAGPAGRDARADALGARGDPRRPAPGRCQGDWRTRNAGVALLPSPPVAERLARPPACSCGGPPLAFAEHGERWGRRTRQGWRGRDVGRGNPNVGRRFLPGDARASQLASLALRPAAGRLERPARIPARRGAPREPGGRGGVRGARTRGPRRRRREVAARPAGLVRARAAERPARAHNVSLPSIDRPFDDTHLRAFGHAQTRRVSASTAGRRRLSNLGARTAQGARGA